jgi:hypothetical protein
VEIQGEVLHAAEKAGLEEVVAEANTRIFKQKTGSKGRFFLYIL